MAVTIGTVVETVVNPGITGTYNYIVTYIADNYSLRRHWMVCQGRAETTDNWCGVHRQTLGDP